VEPTLAARITREISIPTIGIGSGEETDGQVLVLHDLVGLTPGRVPKFVKPLAQLGDQMRDAARAYVARVKKTHAPSD
jgi:3-methyl-2-oxobutanoate hydroxymethyltransferase